MTQTPATPDPEPPFTRRVLSTHPRRYDLDVHVCAVRFEERDYIDIREYIPSLEQYGRGILLPRDIAGLVATSILRETED